MSPLAVNPSTPRYDLVVRHRGQELYLRELLSTLEWSESLDEVAVRLKADFPADEEVAAILRGSQGLYLTGLPFGGKFSSELWRGLAWSVDSSEGKGPRVNLTGYDPLIYTAKTQDDWFFERGQTATQIIRASAAALGVPVGELADTQIALDRQIKRASAPWQVWRDALVETAKKGGALFRTRMTGGRLELVQLGRNPVVWLLEIGENVIEASRQWSRDGITSVAKVVGQATSEETPRPVLAVFDDPRLVSAHGTLQRILSDPDVTTPAAAVELARHAIRGPQESISIEAPDINTLRAGDAVVVRDRTGRDYPLLVDQVTHEGSKGPGRMQLTLMTAQQIRWRWIAS